MGRVMDRFSFSKYGPKTHNPISEGRRLGLLNIFLLITISIAIYGALWSVDRLRTLGLPLPLPVGVLMLATGIPYFIIWFKYGKEFGLKLEMPNFLRGLAMGFVGQVPGFILYFILNNFTFGDLNVEYLGIMKVILRTLILVVPFMAGLGSLDRKRG